MSHRPLQPVTLLLNVANLPLDDLAPYPHCVTWAWEWRDGKNGKPGGWTKVPKNPQTGQNARSNDSTTWGSTDDVLARFDQFGYVVAENDPFTFIDVDDGITPETGELKPWAHEIVYALPSAYWEQSISGTGLKGLIRGHIPANRIIPVGDGQVELFFSGKFTVLTGNRLPESWPMIGEGQAQLDALYAKLFPKTAPTLPRTASLAPLSLDDAEALARCRRMSGFAALYDRGDLSAYGNDHSRGDLGLLSYCVSAGITDPAQLDRFLRSSALYRDKWERTDYRERTLAKVLDGTVTPFQAWDHPPIPLPVVPSTPSETNPQTLGFTPGPCGDRVADLEQKVAQLERENAALRRITEMQATRIDTLQHVQSVTSRILGNKSLGRSRVVAATLATQVAWRATAGETPAEERDLDIPRGMMLAPVGKIAEKAGVSDNTATAHLQDLADRGLIQREVKTVRIDVDQRTGELYDEPQYINKHFIGPANVTAITPQIAIELANTLANFSEQRVEKRGGKRTPRCPDHPTAPVIREYVDRCSVPNCRRQLNDGEMELPPMLLEPALDQSPNFGDSLAVVANHLYGTKVGDWSAPSADQMHPPPRSQPQPLFDLSVPPVDHRTDVAYGARR